MHMSTASGHKTLWVGRGHVIEGRGGWGKVNGDIVDIVHISTICNTLDNKNNNNKPRQTV